MNGKSVQQNIWELQEPELNKQLRRAQAVRNMLKNSRPKLILDIGCAEGFITSFLTKGQTHVVGVDLDESIKVAKKKVKNAEFVCASITRLPFKDKCFEAVTLLEVLEHLPDSVLKDGIKEIDRTLNTGVSTGKRTIQRKNNLYSLHILRKNHPPMGTLTFDGRK